MKSIPRTRLEAEALTDYTSAVAHWIDMPDYVGTSQYRDAFMAWIGKQIDAGRTDIHYIATMALHHETGGREPYFDFPRGSDD